MNLLSLLVMVLCFARSHSDDHTSLVFHTCADQTPSISSPKSHSQALSTLFHELVSRSSDSKFFQTSESSDDGEAVVFGLFQCRNDIDTDTCQNCVRALPAITAQLCPNSPASHVQLSGCYLRYTPEGFSRGFRYETALLHKSCGELNDASDGAFEAMRDAAFGAVEGEIGTSGGFCKRRYELVEAKAQCGGEIEACECGECVSEAAEIARRECGGAFSGEVFMDRCSLIYAYYPRGVPGNLNPEERESNDRNGSDPKTVAIVIGGVAALGIGVIFMMCFKSWTKKDDD